MKTIIEEKSTYTTLLEILIDRAKEFDALGCQKLANIYREKIKIFKNNQSIINLHKKTL